MTPVSLTFPTSDPRTQTVITLGRSPQTQALLVTMETWVPVLEEFSPLVAQFGRFDLLIPTLARHGLTAKVLVKALLKAQQYQLASEVLSHYHTAYEGASAQVAAELGLDCEEFDFTS